MLKNIFKKGIKEKNEIKKRKAKKEKKALLKIKGVTKKSANLIRTHDEEFRIPCG